MAAVRRFRKAYRITLSATIDQSVDVPVAAMEKDRLF